MGGVAFTNGTATVTVAFVGAVVAALSWLGKSAISAVVWYHGRRTREMEMIVALVAEIETAVGSLEIYAARKTADDINAEIAARPDYKIFIPLDREYFVFDRVKVDLTLLPERTILEVVRFYDGIGAFDTLVASFQEPRFESFPTDRRMAYVGYMVDAAASIVADGRKAKGILGAELERVRHRRRLAGIALIVLLSVALAGIVAAVWAATSVFGALMGAGLPSVEGPGG